MEREDLVGTGKLNIVLALGFQKNVNDCILQSFKTTTKYNETAMCNF
jgi:hypothetical protein